VLVRGFFDLEVRREPLAYAAGAVISFGLIDIQYCMGSACGAQWSCIQEMNDDSYRLKQSRSKRDPPAESEIVAP